MPYLVDTDVLIDVSRNNAAAIDFLDQLRDSWVSQFLTKKSNTHLRQIIGFTSAGPAAGESKDNYQIVSEYRELMRRLIEEWNVAESSKIKLSDQTIEQDA